MIIQIITMAVLFALLAIAARNVAINLEAIGKEFSFSFLNSTSKATRRWRILRNHSQCFCSTHRTEQSNLLLTRKQESYSERRDLA